MRIELLERVACPCCQGALSVAEGVERGAEIWEGRLVCGTCVATFPVRKGIPYLYVDDQAWQPKAREAEGWVSIHKELGIYEQVEDAIDLQIPYYPEEPWIGVARNFDRALQELALTGNEVVLDLGAGRGWAAKQFALRGCPVVALDVVADDNVGLGRARALMEHAGTYFERVVGDGENLPFRPDTFDLVFCSATLHHTSDLPLLLGNVHQVLKPGGVLCAINEPSLGLTENERTTLARVAEPELRHGINERRPSVADYAQALHTNGFRIVKLIPTPAYTMGSEQLQEWGRDLGAIFAYPTLAKPVRSVWRVYNFLKARLLGMVSGHSPVQPIPEYLAERERTIYQIMLWSTQELLLLARKEQVSAA